MARPRKPQNAKLPDYVYLTGGRYVYRKPGQKDVRIAAKSASVDQVWRAYHAIVGIVSGASLKDLFRLYRESPNFKRLAPKTRREYEKAHDGISGLEVDGRKFGDVPYAAITTGAAQSMLDYMAETPVKANRWLSAMSVAFGWGKQRDKVTANPCLGVDRYTELARTRYVQDDEFNTHRALAEANGFERLSVGMELAYLCRLREIELVRLKRSDARQDGLLAERVKGSKTQIIALTNRLEAALARSKSLAEPESIFVLPNQSGGRLTAEAFRTDWQRFRAFAAKHGKPVTYTFHDLKAKGVTDFEGDKFKASGHKTPQMTAIYDRLPEVVKATK